MINTGTLNKLTVVQLKIALQELGVSVSGLKKDDLIKRIEEYLTK
ncbi:hypothetical protein NEOLI_004112 [Neolecta irregularis DAH-3]|uniref:SAP domain-containing protein n=1 Tax=Neolecta irregularis (strain DAH-3) TaxID=1198029 RepID=A0A1U7LK45_NEOID|nr:hypothetical protein NEOLI_004112 [Neolecta irregularis DAH-3]|eukprot:OLL23036.1 hypothetical protein NEOLI_004112 [Neolecta irregularis DAH-3]